jgi:hypothetical protein
MSDINTFVEEFQELSLEDQEFVAELIKKQLVESRRQSLVDRVAEARENYRIGRTKSGSINDLMEDLEND